MSAYTDDDVRAAAARMATGDGYDTPGRTHVHFARWALDAAAPAIVARAKAEALREAADEMRRSKLERMQSWPLSDSEQCENERCERALRKRADEIERGQS